MQTLLAPAPAPVDVSGFTYYQVLGNPRYPSYVVESIGSGRSVRWHSTAELSAHCRRKGIAAALLMASLQASFRAFATTEASLQVVCAKLNKFLCANIASRKFVTFFYAVLDADARTLTYENAGHLPGPLLRSNGTTETLQGGGAVLGALPDWTYQDYTAQLQPGDQLLLSTDGITEPRTPNSKSSATSACWKPLAHATEARSKFKAPSRNRSRPSAVGISATTQPYLFYESLERRWEPTP